MEPPQFAAKRPSWQLPSGVTRGMWEYAEAEHIARDYDEYFAQNRLFDFDEAVLARHFTRTGVVVDLGAGTGRALVPLARRGFHGVAVDLSSEMLEVIGEKAAEENLRIDRLRANMVELDCLAEGIADYCICLFSTLGMIRGSENRRRAIAHVRRILKPGGRFVLHVHNFWYNLRDPGGPWWVMKSLFRSIVARDFEAGDKFFEYRQIPNMYLHVFRRGELCGLLRGAGFRIVELVRLDPQRFRALRRPWLFGDLRANGWIVVCE
ncbi:MAG TPA: methyltransferase domain-containing protein [Pirellulales bacterium]